MHVHAPYEGSQPRRVARSTLRRRRAATHIHAVVHRHWHGAVQAQSGERPIAAVSAEWAVGIDAITDKSAEDGLCQETRQPGSGKKLHYSNWLLWCMIVELFQ